MSTYLSHQICFEEQLFNNFVSETFELVVSTVANWRQRTYNYYVDKENDAHKLLIESLEKLTSQVSAYRDVIRLQYPAAAPMMQIVQEMSDECLELARHQHLSNCSDENPLSNREREVLTQVGRGLLNKEIAFTLGISVRTVEFHIKSVFNKTDTQSRTEAAILALKNGWITN